ncbi:acyl-CoA dehydrogenase family protein [Microbispora sp. NPDC046933]|uniref:acyl-CoA dehydrogenase family protein n=1 Tax=Microbispora sp. NPDC046933 TaxID=3155618 RepID=UPI0033D8AA8E
MTVTMNQPQHDADVVALAAEVGLRCAPSEAEHDLDATFVAEGYQAMRDHGYLRLAVPTEFGGLGAALRQVVLAEGELARHAGSAALAAAMHLYMTLVQCWRHRRGAPDAEGALRLVAADGMIMATSGGSDWVSPTTTAVEVDGGFRFTGRKTFCSQAPVATVISTSAVLGEPGPDHLGSGRHRRTGQCGAHPVIGVLLAETCRRSAAGLAVGVARGRTCRARASRLRRSCPAPGAPPGKP